MRKIYLWKNIDINNINNLGQNMASNLAGLSNSISNYVKGVGAELGIISGNPGQLYPGIFNEVTSSVSLENWNRLPFPYTFEVLNIVDNSTTSGFKPFSLPIAPSKLSQTEQFSISIKATQGGTVTSHSGNRYKKLTIEGTTGVNPFRGMTGVNSTTGRAIAKPEELKFKSGYEVFNELRNYFRVYYEYKATFPQEGEEDRLIFKNFKDGEFLIVELLDFTMDRTAPRSILYDYKMEFKVLSHFKFAAPEKSFFEKLDSKINYITSKIDVARGIFLGAQETLRQVESSYNQTVLEPMRKVGLAAKALGGVAITAADVGNRVVKNTVTAADSLNILKVLKDQQDQAKTGQDASITQRVQNTKLPQDLDAAASNNGANSVIDLNATLYDVPLSQMPEKTQDSMVEEANDALANPRSFYEDAVADLKRIKANAEDKFNLGSEFYDNLFDRTATLEAESTKEVSDDEFALLGAFNDSISAIHSLISFNDLFKSDFSRRIETIDNKFLESLDLQSLPAVKQIKVPSDTDLERIALEELGSSTRWVEIAELNDLQAPYITQDLTSEETNVKKPGDSLLIPQELRFGFSNVPRAKDIPSTDGMNEVERSLGTDLKLSDKMDLSLANNGDLEVISGVPNMAQAIVVRIGYERGEIINHPELGVGVRVGEKFITIEQVRDNLISTLTQDSRIDRVSNISLLREGPALYMNFEVHIKNIDTPVPLIVQL